MGALYLIDGMNNNKVVGQFENITEVNQYLEGKKNTENWENSYEKFEDFKDEFITVTSEEMEEAVRVYGSRKRNYWN